MERVAFDAASRRLQFGQQRVYERRLAAAMRPRNLAPPVLVPQPSEQRARAGAGGKQVFAGTGPRKPRRERVAGRRQRRIGGHVGPSLQSP